jgi:hypothetical protein
MTAQGLKDTAVAKTLADVTRPARRRISPHRFKETYIDRALSAHDSPTYVEIGVGHGASFRQVKAARKLGIDPARTRPMETLRPGEEFFDMGSDAFFADHAPRVLEPASVHVALIDGLHEFRQVVRDLVNLEPYMRPDGVVFLDDLNPATRERGDDRPREGAWNGDVWKIVPFVQRARSDLRLSTVDADQGVGVVTGFGGAAEVSEEAVKACKALDYAELDRDRAGVLNLVPPARFDGMLEEALARAAAAEV